MAGVPQPFSEFQGMVSMWSVKVCPNTSLLDGGGVFGFGFGVNWTADACDGQTHTVGTRG